MLAVVLLLLFKLLDLLGDGKQIFGFLVVAFEAVTSHATALAEEIFAIAYGRTYVVAQHVHVRGVASLAARFHVPPGEERPEPVLVGAVRFFNAGGCAPVALVARRTSIFIGIVNFQ